MNLGDEDSTGLALGAWGAVQATATGLAVAAGGGLRDYITMLATGGHLGPALTDAVTGYSAVYHIEIALLLAALVALGPLVRRGHVPQESQTFGLQEFPS
jgi:BCD family chlorophyll transporter-like MFS transporter